MVANAPLSHDADGLHGGAGGERLLDRLNRTVDRLFSFELQAEELRALAGTRKVVERVPALHGGAKRPSIAGRLGRRATLGG
jgi:hypothetical protein